MGKIIELLKVDLEVQQSYLIINHACMIGLQMLVEVPTWALERGLDDRSFNLLEQCVLTPRLQDKILAKVDEGTACCVKQSLKYAYDKGLV